MRTPRGLGRLALVASWIGAACTGIIGEPGSGRDGVESTLTRRLSNVELRNALQAVFGVDPPALRNLPADSTSLVFDRIGDTQTVIDRHVDAFGAIADETAAAMTDSHLAELSPACAAGGPLGADGPQLAAERRPCAVAMVELLGSRAFRRPITAAESARALAMYDAAAHYHDGIAQVVRWLVLNPAFLYVIERGTPVEGSPGVVALTPYELATRLSLAICESPPDAELLDAAASGRLADTKELARQAGRLLDLPCGRVTSVRFFRQWLKLTKLEGLTRGAEFPDWRPELAQAMAREDELFFEDVIWNRQGKLGDLFAADHSFVDATLREFYGLPDGGAGFERATMPPERGGGVLTHGSLLAVTSDIGGTSPVDRGVFVLQRLLCIPPSPPPSDVNMMLPPVDGTQTTRQRFAAKTQVGLCKACHDSINPIGYAMEDFDAIGRHRTEELGLPIDSSGAIVVLAIDGLDGAAALGKAIAGRRELAGCFAQHWMRFGLARAVGERDEASLDAVAEAASAGSLRDAMLAMVRTYAFRHRAVP